MGDLSRIRAAFPDLDKYEYSDSEVINWMAGRLGEDPRSLAEEYGVIDPNQGDFSRGVGAAIDSTKALGGGLLGIAGDTLGLDGVRREGIRSYQRNMADVGVNSRPTDSAEGVNSVGDAVDFAQYWGGYAIPQAAEALVSGGLGAAVGKQVVKGGVRRQVGAEVADRALRREAGQNLLDTAGRRGAYTAMGTQAVGTETGAIYGDAAQRAIDEGRSLDSIDTGRVALGGLAAGALEFGADVATLGLARLGPAKGALDMLNTGSRTANAAIRGTTGALAEGTTEVLQTGIEEMGAGSSFEEANFSDPTSFFAGAVGGGGMGTIGGALGKPRGLSSTPEDTGSEVQPSDQGTAAAVDEIQQAQAAEQAQAQAARDQELARIDAAPTFVTPKDFLDLSEEDRRLELADPNSELGQQFREWRLGEVMNGRDRAVTEKDRKKEQDDFLKFTRDDDVNQRAKYDSALDEHIAYLAEKANRSPETEATVAQIKADLVAELDAEVKAKNPEGIRLVEQKARGLLLPAEWRETKLAKAGKIKLQTPTQPAAPAVEAATEAETTAPTEVTPETVAPETPAMPTEEDITNTAEVVAAEPALKGRAADMAAIAEQYLGADWQSNPSAAQEFDAKKGFYNKRADGRFAFEHSMEKLANDIKEEEARKAAPPETNDPAVTETRQAAIQYANEKLGDKWINDERFTNALRDQKFKEFQDLVDQEAPVEATPAQEEAPVEEAPVETAPVAEETPAEPVVEETPTEEAAPQETAQQQVTGIAELFKQELPEDSGLSNDEKRIFDFIRDAYMNNEEDNVVRSNGKFNDKYITESLGLPQKSAKTRITRLLPKLAKLAGTTVDDVRAAAKATRRVESNTLTVTEAAVGGRGGSEGFDTTFDEAAVDSQTGSAQVVKSPDETAYEGVTEEDKAYIKKRSQEKDQYENKRQELADKQRQADNVQMVKTYGPTAIRLWKSLSSDVPVDRLPKNDLMEWISTVEEYEVGDIDRATLEQDQKEIETRASLDPNADLEVPNATEQGTAAETETAAEPETTTTEEPRGGAETSAESGRTAEQVGTEDTGAVQPKPTVVKKKRKTLKIPKVAEEAPAAERKANTEQKQNVEQIAAQLGGEIVYQNGDIALVRGYAKATGRPVYSATKGTLFTNVDVESYTGDVFTEEQLAELVENKQRIEAEAQALHESDPFVTFDNGLAFSGNVSPEYQGVVKEWKDMLGLEGDVYVTTLADAKADKFNLTGPLRAVGSGTLNANERGSARRVADGSFYIIFDEQASTAATLELLAHEMGHIHQKAVFDNAPVELQKELTAAHREWLGNQIGGTAQQLVKSLRARKTGATTNVAEGLSFNDVSQYWKSFNEWYADQVSRWATTQKQPLTAVERFFSRLGKAMKNFYAKLANKEYLPNDAFVQYLDKVKKANNTPIQDIDETSDAMAGSMEQNTQATENTNRLAEWAREKGGDTAAQTVVNFQSVAKFGTDSLKFLHQYVRDSGSEGARKMYRAIKEADKARSDMRRQVESIAARARDLSPERLKKVNDFIGRSTFEQKWGYDPKWPNKTVKVDPMMRQAFNSLSKDEQTLVQEVFQHGENMRLRKQQIAKDLGVPGRFFSDAALEGPYAPLKRFGNVVAILESNQLREAVAAADANNTPANRKRVEELKSDPDHYVVQFFDTQGAADKFVAENKRRGWNGEYSVKAGDIFQDRVTNTEVFERIMGALKATELDKAERDKVETMVKTMYFQSLDERDARFSGTRRKNRAGYEQNMIRSFLSHARAEAALVSTMENGTAINEAFAELRSESEKDRPRLKPVYDMMSRHYADMLKYDDNWFSKVQDKITTFNSVWMLTTSLGYHITNATQPVMVTLPRIAGDFKNYNGAWSALIRGYKYGIKSAKITKNMETEIDISKTPPKYHALLEELQLRNLLDVGMEEDLSSFDGFNTGYGLIDDASEVFGKVVHKLYQVARYVEAQNRISSAIAAYDLAMANPEVAKRQGMTPTEYATSVVEDTQGNFSRMDAPLLIKSLPKVTTQYRKYQLMMGWAYANATKQAFAGESPEMKAMGRRTLGYMVGHAGLFAGATGIPLVTTVAPYILAFTNDGDEPEDLERYIREHVNGPMADVLTRGAFSMFGIDMSTKLSQGKIFDPFPYVDYEVSEDGTKDLFFNAFAGPFGTTVINFARAAEYLGQGDVLKGMEYMLPKGARTAIESYRLATEGYSFKNGDVILDPREINIGSLLVNAIGLPSTEVNRLKWTRGQQYELTQWFGDQSGELRRQYVEAYRSRDRDEMARLRDEWRDLQAAKDRVRPFFSGSNRVLRKQPISDLIRSPRDQQRREDRSREQLGTN